MSDLIIRTGFEASVDEVIETAVTVTLWHPVKHPEIRGVTTYWRDRVAAQEHAQRLAIRCSKPCIVGPAVERIPNVYMG